MNRSAPVTPDSALNPHEVLRLKCPSCGGGLNLKRQYVGIAGICVHCNEGIRAGEDSFGEVLVRSLRENATVAVESTEFAQPVTWEGSDQFAEDSDIIDLPVEVEEGNDRISQSQEETEKSPWGFPAPKEEGAQEDFSAFSGTMNAVAETMPEREEDHPDKDTRNEQDKKSTLPPPDNMSVSPHENSNVPEPQECAFPFGQTNEDFTFDPASPWANREVGNEEEEEEESPGFAETLFPTGKEQPSPPEEEGSEKIKSHLSSPLVDKPTLSSAAIGLAMEKQKRGEKAGPVTRLMRFVIVLTLLFGFGYVAVLFAPKPIVDSAKEKVSGWLQSNGSLKDHLPFELPSGGEKATPPQESHSGESTSTEKVSEGVINLGQQDKTQAEAEKTAGNPLPPE